MNKIIIEHLYKGNIMEISKTNEFIRISLSSLQLWYIAKIFGPGWVFGIENPIEGIPEEEILELEKQAVHELEREGLVKFDATNQIRIDEMLSVMVYSCIHSETILAVNFLKGTAERYYHFLPQWQLELLRSGDVYSLTYFKEISYLFSHILDVYKLTLNGKTQDVKFSIGARDLEIAAFLFESGKKQKAKQVFNDILGRNLQVLEFLHGYLNPDFHLVFSMLYHRNDDRRIHVSKNELLQMEKTLYWVSHDEAGEQLIDVLNFTSITPEEAEHRFIQMLPRSR
jgi:hypothetical protein